MKINKRTRVADIGGIKIGGKNPVAVQSMCNTDTCDVAATVSQIIRLENAGCEIVRIAVPDMPSARAIEEIKKQINIPLVADIHFDWRLAVEAVWRGADKIRINPGNIGNDDNTARVADICAEKSVPIRIGVNAGSLKALKKGKISAKDKPQKWARVMVDEAFGEIEILEKKKFRNIVVSLKADDIERTVLACELFAKETGIPQHIGITEAGTMLAGTVKSSIALGELLKKGIGATIRVSLTADPVMQVRCAYEILKSCKLREYGPDIISCPTCARMKMPVRQIVEELEEKIYSDAELINLSKGLKIAVMGCEVNGPGEAKEADFGIVGAGDNSAFWIEDGKIKDKIQRHLWLERIIGKIISYSGKK